MTAVVCQDHVLPVEVSLIHYQAQSYQVTAVHCQDHLQPIEASTHPPIVPGERCRLGTMRQRVLRDAAGSDWGRH